MAETVAPRGSHHYKSHEADNGTVVDRRGMSPQRRKVRSTVAGLIGLGMLTAGVGGLVYKGDKDAEQREQRTEQQELAPFMEGMSDATVNDSVMIFHKGVNYRSTPHIVKDRMFTGDNVSGTVDDALVIRKPVISRDEKGDAWAGFQVSDEAPGESELTKIGRHTYWVNLSEVKRQQDYSEGDRTLIETYPVPVSNGDLMATTASFDNEGVLRASDGQNVGVGVFTDIEDTKFILDSFSSKP